MMSLIAYILLFLLQEIAFAQRGEYPVIENLAPFKPVSSTSVCGRDRAESYCLFTTNSVASFAPNCITRVCNNTCPFGSQLPQPLDLIALGTFGAGVTLSPAGPGSQSSSVFINGSSISIPPESIVAQEAGLSLAAWINLQSTSERTLFSKSNDSDAIRYYTISISPTNIRLDYHPLGLQVANGENMFRSVNSGILNIDQYFWHHITLTVYMEDVTYYINGSVVGTSTLEAPIADGPGLVYLGEASPGVMGYVGQIQDAYFYTQALEQRDVQMIALGTSSFVHLASECRCPPSHPVIDPINSFRCTQHTGHSIDRGTVQRLNQQATPPGFMNNMHSGDQWISAINQPAANVTIKLSYTNFNFEVFYIILYFGSPRPKAAILQQSNDYGESYTILQYYADDCMEYFGITNNHDLCTTTDSTQIPTSGGFIQFVLPAGSSITSDIRIQFIDFFNNSQTTTSHLYYSITETTIVGRCQCNGHGARCTVNQQTASCQCTHNTEGTMCERCKPLFNDKPWRQGTPTNSYPCKSCNCNNHATSCYYDQDVDLSPDSYEMGGGGMCNCTDNTTGQNCETCVRFFYRPVGHDPSASDACIPCNCNVNGITDDGDCVKSGDVSGEVAGKCNCKINVEGLQCDICKNGFYNLSQSNPDGCQPCNCNLDGTVGGSNICDSNNGQCTCKNNVVGLQCDQCRAGTVALNGSNPDGCLACQCHELGSTGCDSFGVCQCKNGVTGDFCDQCEDSFYNLTINGCQRCMCHPVGAASLICNKVFGNCSCQSNVDGPLCDQCGEGFYNISQGCIDCQCNLAGSVSNVCNSDSGQCICKSNVGGRACDECITGTANLEASNENGCSNCTCFAPNTLTVADSVCNSSTSQCNCQFGATGMNCDSCIDGFYITEQGCIECACDSNRSIDTICNTMTGACRCRDNFTGPRCELCNINYYQYPECLPCDCNAAGSIQSNCTNNGQCNCKQFVAGQKCDACMDGFMFLEVDNPQGCSAAPEEQAPPSPQPLNFSAILLTWGPPESPNGAIISYILYRDNEAIANVTGLSYIDNGLEPITQYSYSVAAINRVGIVRSESVSVTTLDGIPEGIQAPIITFRNSTAITGTWNIPQVTNGMITSYRLQVYFPNDTRFIGAEVAGNRFVTTVNGLKPFTMYNVTLIACTNGGCGESPRVTFHTTESSPQFQTPPDVITINSTAIDITWLPPQTPNGIIIRYEVILHTDTGETSIASVSSDQNQYVMAGLSPATRYGVSITSYTMAGGTQSTATFTITGESAPAKVRPLNLVVISAASINITWYPPIEPNGNISLYQIIMVVPREEVVASSGMTGSTLVTGLTAFTNYSFLVEACTAAGCTNSSITTTATLEIAPTGQTPPRVTEATSTSLSLTWLPPSNPNGVINSFVIQRRNLSLDPYPDHHERGVFFIGTDYAEFPPNDAVTGFTTDISLYIHTLQTNAALIYTRHATNGDFITLQLRNGMLWFIYDCGSGPAAIPSEVTINDGIWHRVVLTRSGVNGMITVDDTHSASGSSMGSNAVIGDGTALYVGGIPDDVSIVTNQNGFNPNATLTRTKFAGCLRDVLPGNTMLDFAVSAEMNVGINPLNVGCPMSRGRGIHFYGGGYISVPGIDVVIPNQQQYSISVNFRTTSTSGTILAAYSAEGPNFLLLYLLNGGLNMVLSTPTSEVHLPLDSVPFSLCDGLWKSVIINLGDDLQITTMNFEDNVTATSSILISVQNDIQLNSYVYLGGVPINSSAQTLLQRYGLEDPYFGGCLQNVVFNNNMIDVASQYSVAHLVSFAGCPVEEVSQSCIDSIESVNQQLNNDFTNQNLNPFVGYLYKVISYNSVGNTSSNWITTRTASDAPTGISAIQVVTQISDSITVTWGVPTYPNGILTGYTITAVPIRPMWGAPNDLLDSMPVSVNTSELRTTLTSLQFSTIYFFTVTAYTDAGGNTGPETETFTLEGPPESVLSPSVTTATTTSLSFSWSNPLRPNGDIRNFTLQLNDTLFTTTVPGSQMNYTVTSLMPFTQYQVVLTACTLAGCAMSNTTIVMTLPDAPSGLAAPNATVLSSTSILVNWQPPAMPNGIIVLYEVVRVFEGSDFPSQLLQNTTGLMVLLTDLEPNTLYILEVVCYNDGGSTRSPPVEAFTLEGVPEGIVPPRLVVINSTAINVTWSFPQMPNGQITAYRLIQDLTEPIPFDSFVMQYVSSDLEPFSVHTYIIQACTIAGCGSSDSSTATTFEAPPEGINEPIIHSITANSFAATIQGVVNPNGMVRYFLYLTNTAGNTERRTVYNSTQPMDNTNISVSVGSLLPFTTYFVQYEAMNGAGSVAAEQVDATTLEADPTGLVEPSVAVINATTVIVIWTTPQQPNGIILGYNVRITSLSQAEQAFVANLSTIITITNLIPFTNYAARIIAFNSVGSVMSNESLFTTGESVPFSIDNPEAINVQSRSLTLSWEPPSISNGILIHYIVMQNSSELDQTFPNTTILEVTDLLPFTTYQFTVMACTSVGCTESPPEFATTLEAAPEGFPAPIVQNTLFGMAEINWGKPTNSNGIIIVYYVERALMSDDNITWINIGTVYANETTDLSHIDTTAKSFTLYIYRIIVENRAGRTHSPYTSFLTPEAAPENFTQPTVITINGRSLLISWEEPLVPNGIIRNYTITRTTSNNIPVTIATVNSRIFNYTDQGLNPFTNYTYTIIATNAGGSTETDSTSGTTGQALAAGLTAPLTVPVNSTIIFVSWDPPSEPNGILESYKLYRIRLSDPSDNGTLINQGLVTNFEDTELVPYTNYQYYYDVVNGAGSVESPLSIMTRTLPGIPSQGPDSIATTINSTAILLSWNAPPSSTLQGPLVSYEIQWSASNTAQQEQIENITADTNMYIISDLLPNTQYTFRVFVFNGVAQTGGSETSAVTLDGIPANVLPPSVTALDSTSLSISWQEPLSPNGEIVLYTIFVNSLPILNATMPDVFLHTGLRPFTNYTVRLQACTTFGCGISDLVLTATLEGAPSSLAPPRVNVTGSTSADISWEPPLQPNGIITEYQVYQQMPAQCPYDTSESVCTYTECPINQSHCGSQCYRENEQVCCDGTVFNGTAGFGCCDGNYISQSTPDDVCCGGRFHTAQDNHVCCNQQYVLVLPGSVCCPTDDGDVAIDTGNTCCGGTPYNTSGSFICCGGMLYSNHSSRTCCGSEMISTMTTECCNGVAYLREDRHSCCGGRYTDRDTTLCCTGSNGVSQVFYYASRDEKISANEQCCQHNKIPASLECCNGVAYNDEDEVCADRSSSSAVQLQCGMGNVCSVIQASSAFCDRCDFNSAINTCTATNNVISTQTPSYDCLETTLVFSGLTLNYQAQDLSPFTQYGFSITAINSAGNSSTGFITVTTLEDSPTIIDAPVLFVESATVIRVSWLKPVQSNGRITNYNLYQNNSLIQSSLNTMLTVENLSPYTIYQYFVEACTNGGCTVSEAASSITLQSVPEGLEPPAVTLISPTELRLDWLPPQQPNGIIILYIVNETLGTSSNSIFQHSMLRTITLSDHTPFTTYYFVLQACNIAGCSTAPTVNVTTPQAPPEGLSPPFIQILTSTTVDVSWQQPNVLNGEIITYILRRNNEVIYNDTELRYSDTGLVANTQYNYTVEAINGGGSVISPPSFTRTPENIPEGLAPPTLLVINSTAIQVRWNPPATPNGVITSYSVIYDNQNIDVGISFEYIVTGLNPATQYSFRIETCNRLGCARSIESTATTDEAAPAGFDNPTLTALGSTAVNIEWSEPQILNGVILRYEAYRRQTGSILQSLQFSGSQTTFINAGLMPFTRYEYRIRAINNAGSVFTEWVEIVTLEDIPQGLNGPTFPLIFARNITVSWTMPSSPNGIITFYEVYQREFLGIARLVARVSGNTTTFIASDLIPARIYEFRIVAINSVGQNESPWVSVSTTEAPPEGLQPIVIESRPPSGTSLVLSWSEPLIPNGRILEYIVYLNNAVEFRGIDMTATLRRLNPFTTYTLQLEVCNSGGCTRGTEQNATTAEIPPVGQDSPQLTIISPTVVQIMWDPPQMPNGIIIQYDIIRQLSAPLGSNTNTSATVFSNVSDVVTRVYVDSSVDPFTFYEYAIRAINSGGETVGPFANIQTSQSIPDGIPAPTLTAVSSSEVRVSWNDPITPNGVITEYRVVRNGSVIRSTLDRLFVDTNLMPFTYYTYSITVCTIAGCGNGPIETVRTMEAAPSGVSPPMLTALSNSSIRIDWVSPSMPNGLITLYTVTILPDMININTQQTTVTVQNLLPFTLYQSTVLACTQAGCTLSIPNEVRTLEGIPRLIESPQLSVLGPTIVEVVWRQPLVPNGVITRYEVQRNGTTIFIANDTLYIDRNVQPSQVYSYTVRAFTSIGAGSYSEPSVIMTSEDTPSGIMPPNLTPLSAISISATWQSPLMPNGNITEYRLIVNGTVVFTGQQFNFNVVGLNPFTTYEFQLMACTSTCGSSERTTTKTLEAAPTGQSPPQLLATAYNMVTVNWEVPTNPNGIILSCTLEQRLVGDTNSTVVFTGLAFSFNDDSLMAATYYEYRVTCFNSIGSNTSDWEQVRLPETIPEGVLTPSIVEITSTSVTLEILPPLMPNGVITMYHVIRDNITIATLIPTGNADTLYTVSNLRPFTSYTFSVQACTAVGCQQSNTTVVKTLESRPLNLAPPNVFTEGPRNLFINWSSPAEPNGEIIRYTLWYQTTCPQPTQPFLVSVCVQGDLLQIFSGNEQSYMFIGTDASHPLPYTRYQFLLQAENSVAEVNSSFTDTVETAASNPEVVDIVTFEVRGTTVSMNWENTFRLNGQLRYFILTRNNFIIRQDTQSSIELQNQPRGERLEYAVTAVTNVGQVTTAPIITEIIDTDTSTTSSLQPTTMSTSIPVSATTIFTPVPTVGEVPTTEETDEPVTERPEFIIAMVIVGLVIIVVCCVVMLCFVRPKEGQRRRKKQPLTLPPYTGVLTPSTASTGYDFTSTFPSDHGWVPNQPPVEGVDDNETLLQRKRVGHYSPHKAQQRLDTRWQTDHDAVDVVKSELSNAYSDEDDQQPRLASSMGIVAMDQQTTFADTHL